VTGHEDALNCVVFSLNAVLFSVFFAFFALFAFRYWLIECP